MKTSLLIPFLISGLLRASAEDKGLRLELESNSRTVRLGRSTGVKLKMVGSEVAELTAGTEGVEAGFLKSGAFVYDFNFKPQREGKFTLGPYAMEVNGRELTSNQIEIQVLPQWDGIYGTFFRVDRESITLGEEIELVVETWSKASASPPIFLGRHESFSSRSAGSGGYSRSSGEMQVTVNTSSWRIEPKKSGVFVVSKDIFRDFPEDVDPPHLSIEVREPAPASDPRP